MRELFLRGGPIMWPILLCSLAAMTVSLERGLFWWRERRRRRPETVDEVLSLSSSGAFPEAVARARGARDPILRLLAEGLSERSHGLSEALQIGAQKQLERMRAGLGLLDTIVTVAPLLGILGTVAGVIGAFDSLGGQAAQDPAAVRAVSEGIGKALITTAAGLCVAIPTLVVYNSLVSALRRMGVRMEQAGTALEVAVRRGAELNDASG